MRKHEGRWLAHAGSCCRHEKPFPPVIIPVSRPVKDTVAGRHSRGRTAEVTALRAPQAPVPPAPSLFKWQESRTKRGRSRQQGWLTSSTRPEGWRHAWPVSLVAAELYSKLQGHLCSCQRGSILYLSDEKGRRVHCDLKYASPSRCECTSLMKANAPPSCPLPMNVTLAHCSSSRGGGGVTETQTICFLFQRA